MLRAVCPWWARRPFSCVDEKRGRLLESPAFRSFPPLLQTRCAETAPQSALSGRFGPRLPARRYSTHDTTIYLRKQWSRTQVCRGAASPVREKRSLPPFMGTGAYKTARESGECSYQPQPAAEGGVAVTQWLSSARGKRPRIARELGSGRLAKEQNEAPCAENSSEGAPFCVYVRAAHYSARFVPMAAEGADPVVASALAGPVGPVAPVGPAGPRMSERCLPSR